MAGQNMLTFTDTDRSFDRRVLESEAPVRKPQSGSPSPGRFLGRRLSSFPRDGAYHRRRSGRVRRKGEVGKLDISSNRNTTMRYNIRGIPTLLLFSLVRCSSRPAPLASAKCRSCSTPAWKSVRAAEK